MFVKTAHFSPEGLFLTAPPPTRPPQGVSMSAFHLPKLFILRGDVTHGYRRNNCPEVASGGLVYTQANKNGRYLPTQMQR